MNIFKEMQLKFLEINCICMRFYLFGSMKLYAFIYSIYKVEFS